MDRNLVQYDLFQVVTSSINTCYRYSSSLFFFLLVTQMTQFHLLSVVLKVEWLRIDYVIHVIHLCLFLVLQALTRCSRRAAAGAPSRKTVPRCLATTADSATGAGRAAASGATGRPRSTTRRARPRAPPLSRRPRPRPRLLPPPRDSAAWASAPDRELEPVLVLASRCPEDPWCRLPTRGLCVRPTRPARLRGVFQVGGFSSSR